jgi:hypothetical protein
MKNEIWEDVTVDYFDGYEVSDQGRFRKIGSDKLINPMLNGRCWTICINKSISGVRKSIRISLAMLVYHTFNDTGFTFYVKNIDGDIRNCKLSNITPKKAANLKIVQEKRLKSSDFNITPVKGYYPSNTSIKAIGKWSEYRREHAYRYDGIVR